MDKSMEILLAKLDEKLDQQTKLITTSVTKNVMAALDEKLKAITEENAQLKNKISAKVKTEIDFIITNKVSAFTDTNIVKNLVFNTDHRMQTQKQKKLFKKETLELLDERRTLISNKEDKERRQKIANLSKEIKENMRKDNKEKRNRVLEENIKRTEGLPTIPEVTEAKENKIDEVPEILASEVIKAIKSQKLEKAPGPDKISNEMLKGTLEETSPVLAKLFNEILQIRRIPEEWTECHIILLHKKGPRDEIGNYRLISLISNIYKIFAKVILERISLTLNESQPVEQAGFGKDFSTVDHIHTIKHLIQKYNEYNKQI
ncbi:Probable RNA-directed DNA polymerase from transposon BS [Eumeta japonica]|uniref:Probable RNA-directed DNA polymerase from transposon BS n=1 Tax=Eumeta variegata TaxID=151549 RepID=A0A4C1XUU6_EUMVA|nr:Probable RNA-directed DNA polymerase from transposon BS [Eumeta japonica]